MEGNRGMLLEDHNDSLLVKKKKKERKKERKEKKQKKKTLPCLLSLRQGESVWPNFIEFYFTL